MSDVENFIEDSVENELDGAAAVGTFDDESSETVPEFPVSDSMDNISLKKKLNEIVQHIDKMETLPDAVAELIVNEKLNTMVLDLYDYDKGFEISFHDYENAAEIFHGQYSYGVSVMEYIKDGEIPYELFDLLYSYRIKLFYDGYIACQLRIHFDQEESMWSHFVLLKHSIQTVDGECSMNCKKDNTLDFLYERARLINHYSPDLCLDPDPTVSDVVFSYELNLYPFITPILKDVINNEKARREKGVREMFKTAANYSESAPKEPQNDSDWNFRLEEPTAEEVELSKLTAPMERKPSIVPYLKERQLCFPDKDSLTGFHVEIENFVYEYDGCTRAEKVEKILDKFCIGVLDDKEFYYGAYQLDDRMKEYVPFYWWSMGSREALDLYVNAITKAQMRLCSGTMKITHNRIFDERVELSDGEIKMVRRKLENPVSRVILEFPPPKPEDENKPETMETD